jgi:hypothetical protein
LQASCLRSCMLWKQFGKLMVFLLNRDGWAPRLVMFSPAWWQMHCVSSDKQVIATNIDYGKWELWHKCCWRMIIDSSPALHILLPYDIWIRHASNLEPTLFCSSIGLWLEIWVALIVYLPKHKISLQNCLQKAMHYTYLRTIEQLQIQVVVRSLKRDLGMVGGTHF